MKVLTLTFFMVTGFTVVVAHGQPPMPTEKQDLVMKFRKVTGADNVNLGMNVSFEDIKNDLVGTVDGDKDLSDLQKQELRSAIEAYDRLDKQLKDFLNDQSQITKNFRERRLSGL